MGQVPQTRFGDPQILGDLSDRFCPLTRQLDGTTTELGRVRSRHEGILPGGRGHLRSGVRAPGGSSALADPRYRHNTAARTSTHWTLTRLMPGRAMHVSRAAKALRDIGIPPGAARTGTWLQLVREAPPSVLANALGISPETAMRHASPPARTSSPPRV
jgi:hypothetical protein